MKKLQIKSPKVVLLLSLLITVVSIYMMIPHFFPREKIDELVFRMQDFR